jgi:predicted acyltransferase
VDVRGWHRGADWLKIYGMNAITAYVIGHVIDFSSVPESLLYGLEGFSWYPVLIAFANASILFGILYWMYRKGVFLKV